MRLPCIAAALPRAVEQHTPPGADTTGTFILLRQQITQRDRQPIAEGVVMAAVCQVSTTASLCFHRQCLIVGVGVCLCTRTHTACRHPLKAQPTPTHTMTTHHDSARMHATPAKTAADAACTPSWIIVRDACIVLVLLCHSGLHAGTRGKQTQITQQLRRVVCQPGERAGGQGCCAGTRRGLRHRQATHVRRVLCSVRTRLELADKGKTTNRACTRWHSNKTGSGGRGEVSGSP